MCVQSCPEGSVRVLGASTCKYCEPGKYQDKKVCKDCGNGKYSPEGSTECLDCEPGYDNPSTKAGFCIACPGGSISTSSRASCRLCSKGSYSSEEGYNCIPCEQGKYASSTTSPGSNSSFCISCPKGTYFHPDKSAADGISSCELCDIGKYSDKIGATSSGLCRSCPEGSYSSTTGAEMCTPCPRGKFQPFEGLSLCFDCPPEVSVSEKEEGSTSCYVENGNNTHPYFGQGNFQQPFSIPNLDIWMATSKVKNLNYGYMYDPHTQIDPNDVLYIVPGDWAGVGDSIYYKGLSAPTRAPNQ
jgi:hypothetical protein